MDIGFALYDLIFDSALLNGYKNQIHGCIINGEPSTIKVASNDLKNGLNGLLGSNIPEVDNKMIHHSQFNFRS
ncbi:MAG: hypothetical protein ACM34O_12010 [Ignavibacteria bacterium]